MAMNYTTLVAPKGTAGSLLNWVGYSKVDVGSVVDELQSLIYSMLRVREMRFQWVFGLPVGNAKIALPARYLDPIGDLRDNLGNRYYQRTESTVTDGRTFDDSISGSFGTDPFTTGAQGSGIITAIEVNHGLNQSSDITIAGAADVDGVTINGTSLVTNVIDADTFQFTVTDGEATAGGITGGGSAATYTANNLISGQPLQWAVWDEHLQFDGAFGTATQFRLMIYKSPPLLSVRNPTNFLTTRYPQLVRVAGMASAAAFMKDDNEYTKHVTAMQQMIQSIQAESDLGYRGADLYTETPGGHY
jgi:hypothetical protein